MHLNNPNMILGGDGCKCCNKMHEKRAEEMDKEMKKTKEWLDRISKGMIPDPQKQNIPFDI